MQITIPFEKMSTIDDGNYSEEFIMNEVEMALAEKVDNWERTEQAQRNHNMIENATTLTVELIDGHDNIETIVDVIIDYDHEDVTINFE